MGIDTLGDRMKFYEQNALDYDKSECPVVIRLDGNAFHTWVKKAKLQKPFDDRFITAMQQTTLALCERIPGCVMGYVQSDEISLALRCDQSTFSQPWFSNRAQKLCSVTASMAAAHFNDFIRQTIPDAPLAYFDSRVMYMPSNDEVINCFIWRQNDCVKNSVSSLAQSLFSQKQLLNKHQDEQIQMMLAQGVDWSKLSTVKKHGTLIHRKLEELSAMMGASTPVIRSSFFIDTETPRFTQNKKFIEDAYNFVNRKGIE